MTTLKLVHLTKEYREGVPAVAGINLTIQSGELLALLGPSGCGKTTTLRLIAGLLEPTSGDLLFNDRSILNVPPEKRGAVMVFQDHPLFPFMSVGDNVAFGLKIKKLNSLDISERVNDALSKVHLAGYEDRWPDELSGGQRQRVALARALVLNPRVLLLDEPLSNLETGLREEIRTVIQKLVKKSGITTIFVTHDQSEAIAIADRIALLKDGRIRQIGSPRALFENPVDENVADFFGSSNIFHGTKRGFTVDTPIGPLKINRSDIPDGNVLVSIRPEAFEIGSNGGNSLPGIVLDYQYRGIVAQCKCKIKDVELTVFIPPYWSYNPGETITLHIPKERISLFTSHSHH